MTKKKEETIDSKKVLKANTKKVSKKNDKVIKKEKNKKKGNIFSEIWAYLKSVKLEMTKVRWPSKKEMLLYSSATLGFIIIFAVFFMFSDVVISAVKQLVR